MSKSVNVLAAQFGKLRLSPQLRSPTEIPTSPTQIPTSLYQVLTWLHQVLTTKAFPASSPQNSIYHDTMATNSLPKVTYQQTYLIELPESYPHRILLP